MHLFIFLKYINNHLLHLQLQYPYLVLIHQVKKKFFYFYPNEPNSESQRYFNSISGIMTETNSEIIVEDGHRYVFEKGNFVSKEDFELLWLNVFARDPKTAKQVMDIVRGGYVYLS